MILKRSLPFLLILGLGLMAQAQDTKLVVAVPSYLNSHVPGEGWSYYQRYLMNSVYQRLFSYDEFGHIQGELLTSWKISNNHKTIEFQIKKGVRFSDGSPLTIEDVLYSLSRPFWGDGKGFAPRVLGPALGVVGSFQEGRILPGLEKVESHSFRLHLQKPYTPLFDIFSSYLFTILKKDNPAIGSGPYLAEKLAKDRWRLKINPKYQQSELQYTEIELLSVLEAEEAEQLLVQGRLDMAVGFHLRDLQDHPQYVISGIPKPSYNHFFINKKSKVFADIENRKVLAAVLRSVVMKSSSKYETPVNTLLPRGLLPPDYHAQKDKESLYKISKQDLAAFKQKIKMVLVGRHFEKSFVVDLKKQFQTYQLPVELEVIKGPRYGEIMQAQAFDVVSYPVIPTFHDPDGYYSDPTYYSTCSDDPEAFCDLKKDLQEIRFQPNKLKRLELYVDLLNRVQQQKIIVPGFKTSIPIAVSNRLLPPVTNYRDQMRLWKLRLRDE